MFRHLEKCGNCIDLLDKLLTRKVVILLLTTEEQILQTLLIFSIDKTAICNIFFAFIPSQPLKHPRNVSHLDKLSMPRLC